MINLKIIYEDDDILAVNKPAGINVHPDEHHKENTLIQIISQKYPQILEVGDDPKKRPGVVHRLDRDTSGVLILAKSEKSFEYLKNLFKNQLIKKTYIALVSGKLGKEKGERGVVDKPIARSARNPILRTARGKIRGELKSAITEYKILDYFKLPSVKERYFTLVEVYPKTGRTHQIRAHFKALGAPVTGDKLYGGKSAKIERLVRQFLHAASLEFTLPSGGRIKLEADLPDDLKSFLEKLKQAEV